MKKLLLFISVITIALLLAACGSSSPKNVTDNYYKALQKGDYEKALSYTTVKDDDEEIKNTTDNFNDCSHWYKALAYLKANDKESAIKELNELIEDGHNDILIERATDLLKKLKR